MGHLDRKALTGGVLKAAEEPGRCSDKAYGSRRIGAKAAHHGGIDELKHHRCQLGDDGRAAQQHSKTELLFCSQFRPVPNAFKQYVFCALCQLLVNEYFNSLHGLAVIVEGSHVIGVPCRSEGIVDCGLPATVNFRFPVKYALNGFNLVNT